MAELAQAIQGLILIISTKCLTKCKRDDNIMTITIRSELSGVG